MTSSVSPESDATPLLFQLKYSQQQKLKNILALQSSSIKIMYLGCWMCFAGSFITQGKNESFILIWLSQFIQCEASFYTNPVY